jgi:hypothetical protein
MLARVGLAVALVALAACGGSTPERTANPSTVLASGSHETTTTTAPGRPLRKVLLLGDSEMFDAAPYTIEGFRTAGVETNSQAFPGTSLLGVSKINQTFPTVVAEQHPDAVILLYSGVYLPPLAKTADGRDILLATPEFWDAWSESAAQATRDLSAEGAAVYWILLPHNHVTWSAHDTRMNDAYLALQSTFDNVRFVDWRKTIVSASDGAPRDVASIGPNGTLAPVRGADGSHFSADASRVLADVMVSTVLQDYGVSAAS